MVLTRLQVGVLLLLIIGETLSIYAEMLGARNFGTSSTLHLFLKMLVMFTLAGGLLIGGYMLGFSAFKNIWVVSAISVGSLLIVEPLLAYTLFGQLPTRGALIGFLLGIAGILSALFF